VAGHNSPVIAWAKTLADGPYVTQMTWAHVRSESQRVESPRKRESWRDKLDREVPAMFGARLLPISVPHLQRWSEVRLEKLQSGKALSDLEALDWAVCIVEDLGYVTRNEEFSPITGLPSHSPWT
jgi:hypothetical protein